MRNHKYHIWKKIEYAYNLNFFTVRINNTKALNLSRYMSSLF